jgi:hypothetical protein
MFILIFEKTFLKMKKIIFTICLGLAFICKTSFAQTAVESTIEIMKVNQPCVMATYTFSQDLLDETIKAKFTDAKVASPDKSKGFKIYKGVSYPPFGTDKMDIYIKTDGKKETSICYVALSKGYDNFMTKITDTQTIVNVFAWLNNLSADAAKVKLGHDIEESTSVQSKSEKKYNGMVDDGKDLQKDLEKLQKKMEDNKTEQAKLLKELNEAKAKLTELQAKFK